MNLNLRDFPDELWHKLKLEAVKQRVSLRELVISILSGVGGSTEVGMDGSIPSTKRDLTATPTTKRLVTKKSRATEKSAKPAESGTEPSVAPEPVIERKINSFMDKPIDEMNERELIVYMRNRGK